MIDVLLGLARYPRVFVKISDMWRLSRQSYPYPDAQDLVRRFCQTFGAARLMWDTHWPVFVGQLSYARIVELYRDHFGFLALQEREQIYSKTVQRIWPFGL